MENSGGCPCRFWGWLARQPPQQGGVTAPASAQAQLPPGSAQNISWDALWQGVAVSEREEPPVVAACGEEPPATGKGTEAWPVQDCP